LLNIADNEFVTTITLQKEPQIDFRKHFAFLDDMDSSKLS